MKYESDSDSDSETESKKQIFKMMQKHSKKHGTGFFDDIGKYITSTSKGGLSSDLLRSGVPAVTGALGTFTGGPVGGIAGSMAGKIAGDKIGEKTGLGLSPDEIRSHNESGRKAKAGMGFFTDLAEDLRPITTDPRVQKLITASLGSATRGVEGSGFFTDLANDLRPVTTDPRVQKLITAGLGRATKEAEGSGFGSGVRSRKKKPDEVSRRAFDEYIKNEMDRMARKDVAEARAVRAGKKAKPTGGYGYGLKGSDEMKEKMAKLRAMKNK
jgi:hypothetical protein